MALASSVAGQSFRFGVQGVCQDKKLEGLQALLTDIFVVLGNSSRCLGAVQDLKLSNRSFPGRRKCFYTSQMSDEHSDLLESPGGCMQQET